MEPRDLQIPPPKSWQAFEDLLQALFAAVWDDPNTQKNGRQGQAQHGVDVYGSPRRDHFRVEGVQAKGKDGTYGTAATIREIDAELAKAEKFQPGLAHWTFATTAPSDARLQKHARMLSAERVGRGLFPITVLGWEELVQRLCAHAEVLARFYPGHAFDIPSILARLEALATNGLPVSASAPATWRVLEFNGERDLGPALLGRPLGPADAAACPRLDEADMLMAELLRGYSARLVGDPGGGKSVCACQAAASLAAQGWRVEQLDDPACLTAGLPSANGRTLFIVDDAHLVPPATLAAAEHAAGPERLILSVHNALGEKHSRRGAVVIESRKAVRTIADGLRKDSRTLAAVRRADNSVGDGPGDLDLALRIDQAEKEADYPWQFCFILGGGWLRAARAATAARVAGADVVLAAVAVRQLASRDARPTPANIESLTEAVGVTAAQARRALDWLAHERLIIGPNDLRCPHQRFAAVVLGKILGGQEASSRDAVGRILRLVFADPTLPLAGLYIVLHELFFAGEYRQWTSLLPPDALQPALDRAWTADTSELRGQASFLLTQAEPYLPGWPHEVFAGREATLAAWLDAADARSAPGIAGLINNIYNRDNALPPRVFGGSDPAAVAATVSAATPETAYRLGDFADRLWILGEDWNRRYRAALRRDALIGLARDWPPDLELYGLSELCEGLIADDNALALDMVEAAMPHIRRRIAADPARGFREVNEIATRVLRVLDLLGAYTGNLAPGEREWTLARAMFAEADPKQLASQLSTVGLKQFQSTAFLLGFLRRADPARFRATVAHMDWDAIARTIGEHWARLPHDAQVLMGVASGARKSLPRLQRLIIDNLPRIEVLPARLACISVKAAELALEQGKPVETGAFHVAWHYVPGLVEAFAEGRPDLLDALLAPGEAAAVETFAQAHESFYADAAPTLAALRRHAPQSLDRIFDRLDPKRAEVGWTAAIRAGKGARRSVAHLVTAAVARPDALGDLARRLRKRFPAGTRVG